MRAATVQCISACVLLGAATAGDLAGDVLVSAPAAAVSLGDLALGDECDSPSCAVSALQVRGSMAAEPIAVEESERLHLSTRHASSPQHRRRVHHYAWAFGKIASTDTDAEHGERHSHRRRFVAYEATPVFTGEPQPELCGSNTTRLRQGYEGCCAGQSFEFASTGCCGQMLYRTDQLSCCKNSNGTETIYDRLTQNCCNDPRVDNRDVDGGLCTLARGQPACCHLLSGTRRRRRRRQNKKTRKACANAKSDSLCSFWADQEYCNATSEYHGFMQKACRASCKLC